MEVSNSKTQIEDIKSLKVYSKYFKRSRHYILLPEIRLSGKWLQNLGFICGENIKITTQKNGIIIRNSNKIEIVL